MALDYSPTHKYHHPRLHRERMYGGVEVEYDMPIGGTSYNGLGGENALCAKRLVKTKAIAGAPTVGTTKYGNYINPATTSHVHLANDTAGVNDLLIGAVSGRFSIMLQCVFNVAAGTDIYPIRFGDTASSGWHTRRHTANYYACKMFYDATSAFTYSNWPEVVSDVYNTWGVTLNATAGSSVITKDTEDITNTSAAHTPGAATTSALRIGAPGDDQTYYRVTIYNKTLTHEETAMYHAGLM